MKTCENPYEHLIWIASVSFLPCSLAVKKTVIIFIPKWNRTTLHHLYIYILNLVNALKAICFFCVAYMDIYIVYGKLVHQIAPKIDLLMMKISYVIVSIAFLAATQITNHTTTFTQTILNSSYWNQQCTRSRKWCFSFLGHSIR